MTMSSASSSDVPIFTLWMQTRLNRAICSSAKTVLAELAMQCMTLQMGQTRSCDILGTADAQTFGCNDVLLTFRLLQLCLRSLRLWHAHAAHLGTLKQGLQALWCS